MPAQDDNSSNQRPHHRRRSGRGSGFEKLAGSSAERQPDYGGSDAPILPQPIVPAAPAPDASPTASFPGSAIAFEKYRGTGRRLKIHPLEIGLLWIVSAHLVFLPWALGTMRLWAQVPSLLLSIASVVVALLPRSYTAQHTGGASFRLMPWAKLVRFPVFWLGLALLALIVVQTANPAWAYQTDGKMWWMRAIPHIGWLPSGVRVPFEMWGPWRMLMIYTSAWLTVCAIWIGFTRRRTLQRFFLVVAANGVALALFGLGQRLTAASKMFGFFESPNPAFYASFIYKNHAGGYLLLVLAVASGIGAWYYLRGVRRLEKSNPSGVFAFLATCIAVSVLVSYARGATLLMLGYLTVVVGAFIYHQFRVPKQSRNTLVAIALLIVFAGFLKTGLDALHSDLAWDRLRQAVSGSDLSVEARAIASQASLEMLGDHWGLGSGSGSFRFLFTIYQQHYPAILSDGGVRNFWEHAHNDLLEIPIELGVPGVLLILGAFAFWAQHLLRNYAWQNPLSASVVVGCLFLVAMAGGEFVFQCPAILITWCALWPAAALWAQLEEQREARM